MELKNGEVVKGLIVETKQFVELIVENHTVWNKAAIEGYADPRPIIIFISKTPVKYFAQSDLKIYDNKNGFEKPIIFRVYCGEKNNLIQV